MPSYSITRPLMKMGCCIGCCVVLGVGVVVTVGVRVTVVPVPMVIGPDGAMTAEAGDDFDGMDRMEARQAVVERPAAAIVPAVTTPRQAAPNAAATAPAGR